jgi:predicted acylesterase/phospholipase RssA
VVDGGVLGATPIDVAVERGARVIADVNPLMPNPQTWVPLRS